MIPPGHRQTVVTLRITWDPENNDHPSGWEYETLLGTECEVVDFEDAKEASDGQTA